MDSILWNNSRFRAQLQDFLTRKAGEFVEHYRAMPCSCADDPHRGRVDCLVCYGTGRTYDAGRVVPGTVTMATMQKDIRNFGVVHAGDMVFSPAMHEYRFGDFDKVRLRYFLGASWPGEVVRRRATSADILTYPVKKVLAVARHIPETGQTVSYVEGTDFTVSDRILTWLTGHGPERTALYSIRYNAVFEWIVFNPLAPRFEGNTPLGQRVLLRLRHVVLPQMLGA